MIELFLHIQQVLFAAINAVSRSVLNIMLYSLLSRIFHKWFGFHIVASFFCSMYCISKIVSYVKRLWITNRMKNKTQDEKIIPSELSWESSRRLVQIKYYFSKIFIFSIRTNNENDKFEIDWKYLLDDDTKNMFSSIVNIPFNNGWLFFATIVLTEYQMNHFNDNYIISLIRTISFFIILICGSSIRYQTLYERDKKKFFDFIIKNRDEIECCIAYSNNTIPVGSVCLQIMNSPEGSVIMVQLCQLNSKFNDYFYDVANYICKNLIERLKVNGDGKPIRLVWSLPTCKKDWIFALKANKFILNNSYKDFSFMPLVNSYIEQYEYQDLSSNSLDDTNKNE